MAQVQSPPSPVCNAHFFSLSLSHHFNQMILTIAYAVQVNYSMTIPCIARSKIYKWISFVLFSFHNLSPYCIGMSFHIGTDCKQSNGRCLYLCRSLSIGFTTIEWICFISFFVVTVFLFFTAVVTAGHNAGIWIKPSSSRFRSSITNCVRELLNKVWECVEANIFNSFTWANLKL